MRLNTFWRARPPRLRTVLLLGNLTVLALPVAGLWALRLYESALVRQTEFELVAQAAVLAGALRERLRIDPLPGSATPAGTTSAAATPTAATPIVATPAAAALHLARNPGLDLATDPVLPPQPDDAAAGPADPALQIAGQALTPVLRDAQAITLASLRLTDRAGVIVATTGNDLGRSLAGWPEVARVLSGEVVATGMHRREPATPVPGGISRASGLRVFVALPVDDDAGTVVGAVVLSRTPNTLGSAVWGKSRALGELALLLLLGGALLAAGISRLVARPLAAVVAQAEAVAAGGQMAPIARPGTREVAALSGALARMAAVLAQRAGYITAFSASVSHEFKAPLAAIRGAGELLEEHGDSLSPAERDRLARLVAEGVERLERLVRRLVDLGRAEMMQSHPEAVERTALDGVLARIAARFDALPLTISAAPSLHVALGAGAMEAVLVSLLENAAAHAPGAAVRIEAAGAAGRVRLVVADDGPGIAPADRDRVFEPFFTTAGERGGTGLGLSIVRALLAAGHGTIRVAERGRGACFVVDLPSGLPSGGESESRKL